MSKVTICNIIKNYLIVHINTNFNNIYGETIIVQFFFIFFKNKIFSVLMEFSSFFILSTADV